MPIKHEKRTSFQGIDLTHPDRVYYPDEGITKADLCAYYEKVATKMLLIADNRVVSVVRCPKGITGQRFFEKHMGSSKGWPKAMKSVQVVEKSGHKTSFACISGLASIIAAVQMGTLEFHIWGSKYENIEKPDRLVFDLDPSEDIEFSEVKNAAFDVKRLLEKYGSLKSVPMLSGGKGIHIIAPMIPSLEWPEVSEFSKNLAKFMESSNPDKYISTSVKSKRKGLIFVDYLRNGRGATAVAPYSTRARKGAPVAAPITWDELKNIDSASAYNVDKMLKRIEEPDPWEDSYTWKQKLIPRTFK